MRVWSEIDMEVEMVEEQPGDILSGGFNTGLIKPLRVCHWCNTQSEDKKK